MLTVATTKTNAAAAYLFAAAAYLFDKAFINTVYACFVFQERRAIRAILAPRPLFSVGHVCSRCRENIVVSVALSISIAIFVNNYKSYFLKALLTFRHALVYISAAKTRV